MVTRPDLLSQAKSIPPKHSHRLDAKQTTFLVCDSNEALYLVSSVFGGKVSNPAKSKNKKNHPAKGQPNLKYRVPINHHFPPKGRVLFGRAPLVPAPGYAICQYDANSVRFPYTWPLSARPGNLIEPHLSMLLLAILQSWRLFTLDGLQIFLKEHLEFVISTGPFVISPIDRNAYAIQHIVNKYRIGVF